MTENKVTWQSVLSTHGRLLGSSEIAINKLKELSKDKNISPAQLKEYFEKNPSMVTCYDSNVCQTSEDNAIRKVVHTPFSTINGKSIELIFQRYTTSQNWTGFFVTTDAVAHMQNDARINSTAKDPVEQRKIFCTALEEKARFREGWDELKTNGVHKGIAYIHTIAKRVEHLINGKSNPESYSINQAGTKVIFNSGIPDKYVDYIYVLASVTNVSDNVKLHDYEIVEGSPMLISNGFTPAQALHLPGPVPFIDSPAELIFQAEVDLNNARTYKHIYEERRDRLPADLTESKLGTAIRESITSSLKIQKTDHKFIVPSYNPNLNTIAYLFPLYLEGTVGEKPDLALLVEDQHNGIALIKTVLSLEDAYNNARILGSPENRWLKEAWLS